MPTDRWSERGNDHRYPSWPCRNFTFRMSSSAGTKDPRGISRSAGRSGVVPGRSWLRAAAAKTAKPAAVWGAARPAPGKGQPHAVVGRVHADDTRANRFAASGCRAVEQQAVQHRAGIDDDGAAHLKADPLSPARDQLGGADNLLWIRALEQEGIGLDGLVGQPAATRLLPGQVLVEERDVKTCSRQPLSAERSGRPAANDCNFFHALKGLCQWRHNRNKPSIKYSTKQGRRCGRACP